MFCRLYFYTHFQVHWDVLARLKREDSLHWRHLVAPLHWIMGEENGPPPTVTYILHFLFIYSLFQSSVCLSSGQWLQCCVKTSNCNYERIFFFIFLAVKFLPDHLDKNLNLSLLWCHETGPEHHATQKDRDSIVLCVCMVPLTLCPPSNLRFFND